MSSRVSPTTATATRSSGENCTHRLRLLSSIRRFSARISDLVRPFVKQHGLGRALPGPIDILFGEGDFLSADYVFVRRDGSGIITDRGVEAAPDLVVEIVSSGSKSRDRGIKRRRYSAFGVPEYWIVEWDRKRVEICRHTDDRARQTEIATGSFEWVPVAGGPVLTIDVAGLLRDFDEMEDVPDQVH
jgi:Uma2 family endonuclease